MNQAQLRFKVVTGAVVPAPSGSVLRLSKTVSLSLKKRFWAEVMVVAGAESKLACHAS